MCEICQNLTLRTLSHSLNKYHFKRLKQVMLEKKIISQKKYGFFIYP